MKQRVLVAMSGGVDSSVACLLLKEAGFEVIGVTMCLGEEGGEARCCGGRSPGNCPESGPPRRRETPEPGPLFHSWGELPGVPFAPPGGRTAREYRYKRRKGPRPAPGNLPLHHWAAKRPWDSCLLSPLRHRHQSGAKRDRGGSSGGAFELWTCGPTFQLAC